MPSLVVRLYNVRFGDALLVSVPDDGTTRHILVDVGNVAATAGGENQVFQPIFEDVLKVLGGQPLDLYVMSHEHLDHVQGPLWAANNVIPDLAARLDVQHLWMPASSHPDYCDDHANAKKKLDEATGAYRAIDTFLQASPDPLPEHLEIVLRNNNRFLGAAANRANLSHGRTADCVEFIRGLTDANHRHYAHRSLGQPSNGTPLFDVDAAHDFRDTEFEIWAPEEDSSDYYGRFRPMALGAVAGALGAAPGQEAVPEPPPGVDAGAFYNLVEFRRGGYVDNLLAIDKAANNSSIVFSLTWKGWKLLFSGDAEIRSWKEMNKEGVLSPIHFLKISHHGSHNGTPDTDLLEKILPLPEPDTWSRHAVVSTFENTYSGIPHDETLDDLRDRGCEIDTTLGLEDGEPFIIEFPE